MSCSCNESHDDVEPITYIEDEEYLRSGRPNPYFGTRMVSHLVCRRCMGNICVSDMTIQEYYSIPKRTQDDLS